MRLIDADAFVKKVVEYSHQSTKTIGMALDATPTVDAVEVVRCKNCKHSDWYESVDGQKRCYCMANCSNGLTENDYCSKGERSE